MNTLKKLFITFACLIFVAFCGTTLTACGNTAKVSFYMDEASQNFVSLVVEENGTQTDYQSSMKFSKGTNIRVSIYANQTGVNFDDFELTINGQRKSVVTNKYYDKSESSSDRKYGYFNLAQIDSDQEIYINGVKMSAITYSLQKTTLTAGVALTQDEADEKNALADERLSWAFVSFDGGVSFSKLSDLIANSTTFAKSFDSDSHNSFLLQFKRNGLANGDNLSDLFDIQNNNAITLIDENNDNISPTYKFNSAGYWTVTFNGLQCDSATIKFSFANLINKTYTVILPSSNINYTLTASPEFYENGTSPTLTYGTSSTITFTKTDRKLSYSSLKIYINDVELTMQDLGTYTDGDGNEKEYKRWDDEVTEFVFNVPGNITPVSSSSYHDLIYTVKVEGLNSIDGTWLNVSAMQEDVSPLSNMSLCLVNASGEVAGALTVDESDKAVAQNDETIALCFDIPLDDEGDYAYGSDPLEFVFEITDIYEGASESDDGVDAREEEKEASETVENYVQEISFAGLLSGLTGDQTFTATSVTKTETDYLGTEEFSVTYTLKLFWDEEKERYTSGRLEFEINANQTTILSTLTERQIVVKAKNA